MLHQYLIAAWLAIASIPVVAQQASPTDDHMQSAGKEGSTLGRALETAAQGRIPTVDPDGSVRMHDGETIRPGGLAPGAQREGTQTLEDLGDASVEELDQAGAEAMRRMEQDSRSVGAAYRGVVNQSRESTEALQSDGTLWQQSDAIYQELGQESPDGGAAKNALADTYAACTSETRYRDIAAGVREEGHVYTCERLNIRPDSERRRDVTVADEAFEGGTFDHEALTRDAVVDVSLNIPANAQGVSWDVESSGSVKKIELTTLPTAGNAWVGVFAITYENRPCDGLPADAACAGRPQSAHIRFFGRYQVYEEELVCDPENCLLERDAFCQAEWTCLDSEPRVINGVTVDESYLPQMAPLFPSQTGLCFKAKAKYKCDYMLGQLCWTKPNGDQECAENSEGNVVMDTCDRVEAQAGTCGVVGTRCTEDSVGHGGFCHVQSITYNCSTPVPVSNLDTEIENNCSGAVRCMGDECLNARDTEIRESGDTGYTMARLLLHDHVLSDWEIADRMKASPSKASPEDVEHFAGGAFECRKALGGAIDCCTQEAPGGQALWFELYPKVTRQANALVSEQMYAGQGEGSWKTLADKVYTNAALNLSLTTPLEGVRGGRHGRPDGPWIISKAEDAPPPSTVRAASMAEIKPLFIAAARDQTQDPGWACTQDEYDLAVQRDAGMCAKVGQRCAAGALGACLDKRDVYCCFSSPLSRQVRDTMAAGIEDPFGSAKDPDCSGVSMATMQQFDWNTVPLDDMVARMEQAGVLPTTQRLSALSNVEKIDGQQSAVVREDETRINTIERNRARLAEIDIPEAAIEIEKAQRQNVPARTADPEVVGEITLAQGFTSAFAGSRVPLQLLRTGSVGSVSVSWRTKDGTALAGRDYVAASGRVEWNAGGAANQPRLIHVETLVQPPGNQPARELTIELFDPQGGVVLGDVPAGLVRLSRASVPPPHSGPTRRPPSLALSKAYIGTTNYMNGTMLVWRITATNTSDYTITSLQLIDVPTLPQGIESDYMRMAFGQGHQGAESCTLGINYPGSGLPIDQMYASCELRHGVLLQPNESLTWILFTAFDYGMLVNNQCGAYAQFAVDGNNDNRWDWYSWPAGSVPSCQVSIQTPSAATALEQACEAASSFSHQLHDSVPDFEVALDGFPEVRPGAGDSNIGYWRGIWPSSSFSELFEIDSATPASLRMRLGFERIAGTFASGVTLTISPCKDDLRPVNDTDDGTTGSACRYVGPPYSPPGQPLPGLDIAFSGGGASSACVLEPGQRYYLNYAFYDLREPIVPGQDLCEAENPAAGPCELRFEWHEIRP